MPVCVASGERRGAPTSMKTRISITKANTQKPTCSQQKQLGGLQFLGSNRQEPTCMTVSSHELIEYFGVPSFVALHSS